MLIENYQLAVSNVLKSQKFDKNEKEFKDLETFVKTPITAVKSKYKDLKVFVKTPISVLNSQNKDDIEPFIELNDKRFIKTYSKGGIAILIALAFGAILGSFVLKPLIARPRPFHSMEELSLLIKSPTGFSFPSGHTMSSFSAAYILNYINKKFGYFAIPLAILIAFSRLYLYVHFPSDILAGAILGILISYLTVKVLKINR